MHKLTSLAALIAIVSPVAAIAQEAVAPDSTPPSSVFDGNYLTVGGAATYTPSYEGSDSQVFSGVPLVQGRIAGVGVSPRAGGIGLDFIPDAKDAKVGFSLGPVGTYSRNRHSNIDDSVVKAAGKLKSAIDLGVGAGVTGYRMLNPYDSLSLTVDATWNVNGASKGMVVTPALTYATPVSRAAFVTLNLNAKHVDSDYSEYYYGVSALQSARSGLPQFGAGHGWVSVGGALLGAYDLNGNLLDGGLALIAGASYSKLLNDARDTPYTSLRGDDSQWTFAAGIAFTF